MSLQDFLPLMLMAGNGSQYAYHIATWFSCHMYVQRFCLDLMSESFGPCLGWVWFGLDCSIDRGHSIGGMRVSQKTGVAYIVLRRGMVQGMRRCSMALGDMIVSSYSSVSN